MKGVFQTKRLLTKGVILILLVLFFSIVCTLLWLPFSHIEDTWSLKVLQILNTLGMFILPCIAWSYLCQTSTMGYLQVNKGSSLKNFILTITLAIAALPFINLLSHINQQIELPAAMAGIEAWMKQSEEMAEALINSFLAADNYGTMLFNIFLMAVLPAFSEELFFRGALQNLLSSKNKKHLAIWISAIIFSAIHLQFYGFFPRMLMGVAFGYMLVWSGSLWIPIVAHFTNNAFAVVSHYIITKNEYNMESFELFGTGKTLWVGLLSGVLMCGILYLLRRSLTMSKASSRISSGN